MKASLWQILFALPGIDGARHASVEGMKLLKGVPVATIEEILAEAMESVLRPLLFSGPLDLLARHRQAGQPAYILSASLHEIVQHVADDLGFDGAAGSTCEIIDGVFTGVSLRPLYGEHKAAALHDIAAAAGIDLAESTAYSDSASDLAFLEAVGSPVAVNPDRKLRRIAAQRGWRILRFEQLVTSGAQARTSP